jgi:N-acyl-phosphatidylethanolamine-hydrolysing phospholipase D
VSALDPPAVLCSRQDERGRWINPWLPHSGGRGLRDVLRWQLQRARTGRAPTPAADAFPLARPRLATPRAAADELRITWVGHATFLIQYAGVNILTDPVWSRRASPLRRIGPARLAPPGVDFAALPAIDVVVISHDHYDHLDAPTVRALHRRFGGGVRWVTPPGYGGWFARHGVRGVVELDWWQDVALETPGGALHVRAAPAQHWTRRMTSPERARLWGSFALTATGRRPVYFGGDSGYFTGYRDVGRLLGPFAAVLLPVGAYEPRWFMRDAHMNPEDAVQAYADLGAAGTFVASHWGTFRLTDEPPLEPPLRLREAWQRAGRDDAALWIPQHGETRRIDAAAAAAA